MKSLIVSIMVMGFLSGGCATADQSSENHVSWGDAIQILNSGKVASTMQTHDLNVTMHMTDGTYIETTEPKIDAIFREIKKCGAVCANIAIATE